MLGVRTGIKALRGVGKYGQAGPAQRQQGCLGPIGELPESGVGSGRQLSGWESYRSGMYIREASTENKPQSSLCRRDL